MLIANERRDLSLIYFFKRPVLTFNRGALKLEPQCQRASLLGLTCFELGTVIKMHTQALGILVALQLVAQEIHATDPPQELGQAGGPLLISLLSNHSHVNKMVMAKTGPFRQMPFLLHKAQGMLPVFQGFALPLQHTPSLLLGMFELGKLGGVILLSYGLLNLPAVIGDQLLRLFHRW